MTKPGLTERFSMDKVLTPHASGAVGATAVNPNLIPKTEEV